MKIIRKCEQNEVWNHWKRVEGFPKDNFRSDIRDPLPRDIQWYLAEIEKEDLERIFIISSDDWKTITNTFRLLDVVGSLNRDMDDDKIRNILQKKMIYQNDINGLDRKFILVGPSTEGNLTIIEGNKRAAALQSIGKLVGNRIYLGISNGIRNYVWTRYST